MMCNEACYKVKLLLLFSLQLIKYCLERCRKWKMKYGMSVVLVESHCNITVNMCLIMPYTLTFCCGGNYSNKLYHTMVNVSRMLFGNCDSVKIAFNFLT